MLSHPSPPLHDKRAYVISFLTGIASFALLIVGYTLIVNKIDADVRVQTGNTLTTLLSTTEQAIQSWAKEHRRNVLLWSKMPELRSHTKELLSAELQRQSLLESAAQDALRRFLRPLYTTQDYRGFFIINRNLVNLSSSRDSNVGVLNLLRAQPEFFQQIWAGKTALSLPQISDVPLKNEQGQLLDYAPTQFVGAPILDEKKQVIAVLTLRIDPTQDFTRILQRGRWGNTGETFSFNQNGTLVSESRFDKQLRKFGFLQSTQRAMLNIQLKDPGEGRVESTKSQQALSAWPFTEMVSSALSWQKGINLRGYRSYHGATVIGAWNWLSDLNLGIGTELHLSEAYAHLDSTKNIIFVFTVLSGLLIILVTGSSLKRKRIYLHYQHQLQEQVTNRTRELRDSEQRGRLILQAVHDGVIGMDSLGRASFVNKAACMMLGFNQKELLGQRIHELIHHSYADHQPYPFECCPMHISARDGESKHVSQEVLWRKDGSSFPVEYFSTPMQQQGQNLGVVITFRDISKQQESDRLKNEFISTVNHELRTPLTAILGTLSIINHGVLGELPENIAELLHIAERNSQRLVHIVNDILDLQKIEAGEMKFELQNHTLQELLKQAIEVNQSYAAQYQVRYELAATQTNPSVCVDEARFIQVLSNLLSNAAKFSRFNDTILVDARCEHNRVIISVEDHGYGIPEEFKPHVFAKFSQNSAHKQQGTGLGLNISKKIIISMGGEINFHSEQDKGTTFFITLPVASTDALKKSA